MSKVIKADDYAALGAVRVLPTSIPFPKKEDEERDRLRKRLVTLEDEVRQREETIATLRAEIPLAFERGKAEGEADGLGRAVGREAERLSLLEGAMGRANADLSANLSSLERLAPLLARDCLDIILGDAQWRSESIGKILATKMVGIEKSALVEIIVSTDDFPDDNNLSALAQKAGIHAAIVRASADIASGDCQMRFRLGEEEIGIRQQWNVLCAKLDELSFPEAVI
jgi:hypothetical protein